MAYNTNAYKKDSSTRSEYNYAEGKYSLRKLGAYHMIGDDDYEPQRNNNFELQVYNLSNLYYLDSGNNVDQDEVQQTLTLSTVSVGDLSQEVSIIEGFGFW